MEETAVGEVVRGSTHHGGREGQTILSGLNRPT